MLPEDYLKKTRQALIDAGLPGHLQPERVKCELEEMTPDLAIGEVAPTFGADLVVMATHARKGLYLLLKGSVAQKVLSQGTIAVVLIKAEENLAEVTLLELLRAKEPSIPENGPLKIMVTLDGSSEAENILGPVTAIAGQLAASLHLVMVCPPIYSYEQSPFSGSSLEQENQRRRQEAVNYLKPVQVWLENQNLNAVIAVKQGEIVEQIREYSEEIEAYILAMATHARGPFGQAILGSIATEVLHTCPRPILLVNNTIWGREILENDFHYYFRPEPVS